MISSRNITKMAQKYWKTSNMIQRKRISSSRGFWSQEKEDQPIADRGCFVVYSRDQRRFMIPLKYLKNRIFNDLLKISEEVFGLDGENPIMLPLEALLMEYILLLISSGVSKELEKVLIAAVVDLQSSLAFNEQRMVYSSP